jgi:hypothetical protein
MSRPPAGLDPLLPGTTFGMDRTDPLVSLASIGDRRAVIFVTGLFRDVGTIIIALYG